MSRMRRHDGGWLGDHPGGVTPRLAVACRLQGLVGATRSAARFRLPRSLERDAARVKPSTRRPAPAPQATRATRPRRPGRPGATRPGVRQSDFWPSPGVEVARCTPRDLGAASDRPRGRPEPLVAPASRSIRARDHGHQRPIDLPPGPTRGPETPWRASGRLASRREELKAHRGQLRPLRGQDRAPGFFGRLWPRSDALIVAGERPAAARSCSARRPRPRSGHADRGESAHSPA